MDNSYLIALLLVLIFQTILLGFAIFFVISQRMKQQEFQDFTYKSQIFLIPGQITQLQKALNELGERGTLGRISNHLYQIKQLLGDLKESAEKNKVTHRH